MGEGKQLTVHFDVAEMNATLEQELEREMGVGKKRKRINAAKEKELPPKKMKQRDTVSETKGTARGRAPQVEPVTGGVAGIRQLLSQETAGFAVPA
jgi:hypothetical protein